MHWAGPRELLAGAPSANIAPWALESVRLTTLVFVAAFSGDEGHIAVVPALSGCGVGNTAGVQGGVDGLRHRRRPRSGKYHARRS